MTDEREVLDMLKHYESQRCLDGDPDCAKCRALAAMERHVAALAAAVEALRDIRPVVKHGLRGGDAAAALRYADRVIFKALLGGGQSPPSEPGKEGTA